MHETNQVISNLPDIQKDDIIIANITDDRTGRANLSVVAESEWSNGSPNKEITRKASITFEPTQELSWVK